MAQQTKCRGWARQLLNKSKSNEELLAARRAARPWRPQTTRQLSSDQDAIPSGNKGKGEGEKLPSSSAFSKREPQKVDTAPDYVQYRGWAGALSASL